MDAVEEFKHEGDSALPKDLAVAAHHIGQELHLTRRHQALTGLVLLQIQEKLV